MATSPLTPEQRVNKLGHVVTKHVKTIPAASTTASNLPAPAPLPSYHRERRIKDLTASLDTELLLSPEELFKLRNKLDTYKDPTTYDLLQEAANRNNEQLMPEGNFMYKLIITQPEQNIRETCHYKGLTTNDLGTTELHGYVNGLHVLDQYKNTKMEDLTGTELTTAINLIDIAATLRRNAPIELTGWDDAAVTYRNPELTNLVLANPQHATAIISYIEERHSADPEALRDYLNNTTALNNGVL